MMNELELNPTIESTLEAIQARRRVPRATYRLQFNSNFTLQQAGALAPYLDDLGISDCYASPLLAACPGSEHGYDICDHSRLNPALGDDRDFDAFVAALHDHAMGLILDTVPNHMGISLPDNAWWLDVLENGPGSIYAPYFDIDWQPIKPELENKVLLPILEDQYGQVLESGKLALAYENGAFFIYHYETKLPVAPRSYSAILTKALDHLTLDEADEQMQEFRSILFTLDHLPPRTSQEDEALEERNREKEVIKRRLAALTEANAAIRTAIEAVIAGLNGRPGQPASFDELHALLEMQSYRLAFWRVAAEEINYRRFFDINNLAAIRVELPQVFADTHALIFRWLAEGKVTGLRIDHPDGLRSPGEYFKKLQAHYLLPQVQPEAAPLSEEELLPVITAWLDKVEADQQCDPDAAPASAKLAWPLYVVAEKILSDDEPLPQDWAIDGTTGYDFLNDVNGLFVNSDHEAAFDKIYRRFTGISTDFSDQATQTKEMIMRIALASEINILAHQMERIIEKSRRYRDFTLNSITAAIREVLSCLPIYRTYITPPHPVTDRDRHYIETAVAEARRRNPRLPRSLLNFLRDTLLLRNMEDFGPEDQPGIVDFVMKFQQVSGPLTAKGLEDTAFYIYNRLVSLNEVGGEPQHFGLSPQAFHQKNAGRLACWPHTMLATSTHDTKRSEDVRARLNVLSDLPEAWQKAVSGWSRLNAAHKTTVDGEPAPDANDEYLFYQAVVGAWPFVDQTEQEDAARQGIARPAVSRLMQPGSETFTDFRERILAYMKKATNEAKRHTSWINPNEAYDAALERFVCESLDVKRSGRFLNDLLKLTERVAYYGQFNSLAQLLLKLTSPGVPDIYQGTELWDFSLVDPDNRRPVDFDHRRRLLADLRLRTTTGGLEQRQALAQKLLETGHDGKIKLYVTERTLAFRRDHPDLFKCGDYRPLAAVGSRQNHVVAFSRTAVDETVLVVTPRLVAGLTGGVERPPLGDIWADTWLSLPGAPAGRRYTNLFTGQTLSLEQANDHSGLPLAQIFADFPVALLISESD
jgi:(1->4)-alpha-D-glucan 1-alpha-D-glucosylmutase